MTGRLPLSKRDKSRRYRFGDVSRETFPHVSFYGYHTGMTRYAPFTAAAGIILTITGVALYSPALALITLGVAMTAISVLVAR